MRKSRKEVLRDFERRGLSIAEWARAHGFKRSVVVYVLKKSGAAHRGQAHDIAVELGLKEGTRREMPAHERLAERL